MRGIVRQMLAGKARELETEAERIAQQLEELTAAETQHAQAIQQQEGEQDRLNQRNYELDTEIRQNQNQLNLTALEVDRAENKIAFNTQRASELDGPPRTDRRRPGGSHRTNDRVGNAQRFAAADGHDAARRSERVGRPC